jgi:hypothetical protein
VFLLVLIATSALGNERAPYCATSLFQDAKVALSHKYGRPLHEGPPPEKGTPPEVGDTRTFWAWNLTVMPPTWIQVPATCRAVGEYCYVFVADDQWNVNMDSTDVALVVERFDHSTPADSTQGIYEIITGVFGPPPDEIDGDPKIYIFYSALGCFAGSCFDGYFSVFNEYTELEAQDMGGHSNEVEMFYMSCDPINPTANSTLAVLSHEFEHMIHWNMDSDEASWVDEGCAEYAMYLYGNPDPVTGFPENPDDNLIVWDNAWVDYIETYLFTMYFAEKYGGNATITALVAEQANSIEGVENTLTLRGYSETFEDVFVDWTTANFLDDTSIGAGQYGYEWIDLPPFHFSQHTTYPVIDFSTLVDHWAADYVRFTNGSPMTLSFDGRNNTLFNVRLLKMDDTAPTEVVDAPLDSLQNGVFHLPGFGTTYDTLVMVGAHITSAGGSQYSYSMESFAGVADSEAGPGDYASVRLLPNRPNPFGSNTTVRFSVPEGRHAILSVYDVEGRLVRVLLDAEVEAGETAVTWDGRDDTGAPAAPGVYYTHLAAGGETRSARIVLIR